MFHVLEEGMPPASRNARDVYLNKIHYKSVYPNEYLNISTFTSTLNTNSNMKETVIP